jgi:hypothetical protein
MPRARRKNPGEVPSGGGGGGLLSMYLGGSIGMDSGAQDAVGALADESISGGMDPRSKALLEKDANTPFKANNIFAKPTADRANSEFAMNELSAKGELGRAKNLREFDANLKYRNLPKELDYLNQVGKQNMSLALEQAEKMGTITNKQRLELEEGLLKINILEAKEKDALTRKEKDEDVVREAGGVSEDLPLYRKVNSPLALSAKGNKDIAETEKAKADAEQAITRGISAKGTRNTDVATAEEASLGKMREAIGNNELFGDRFQNAKFDLGNYQRNSMLDMAQKETKALGEGQDLINILNNKVVAKGPSAFGDLTGTPPTQSTDDSIVLPNGVKVKKKSQPTTAPAQPIQAKPPEKTTAVTTQAPPQEPGVVGTLSSSLSNAADTTSRGLGTARDALLKTLPRELLLKLIDPYYKPAPTR